MIHRLIELRGTHDGSACPELPAEAVDGLPHYADWRRHGDAVVRLGEVLGDLGAAPVFASHPMRWLGEAVTTSETPLENLGGRLDDAERQLDDLQDALQRTALPPEHWDTLAEVAQLLEFSQRLLPLAGRGLLDLLDPKSPRAAAFATLRADHDARARELESALTKTAHWIDKLPPGDTDAALAIAPKVRGVLGIFNPAWWRLRKVLNARYDFSKHAVAPSWEQVLADLAAEHAAAASLAEVRQRCLTEFASDEPGALGADLAALADPAAPPPIAALRVRLLSSDDGDKLVADLSALAPGFQSLREELDQLVFAADGMALEDLASAVREIREEGDILPELLPALRDLAATPDRLRRAVRALPLTPEQLEAACARKTLEDHYRGDRMLQRFDRAASAAMSPSGNAAPTAISSPSWWTAVVPSIPPSDSIPDPKSSAPSAGRSPS